MSMVRGMLDDAGFREYLVTPGPASPFHTLRNALVTAAAANSPRLVRATILLGPFDTVYILITGQRFDAI